MYWVCGKDKEEFQSKWNGISREGPERNP